MLFFLVLSVAVATYTTAYVPLTGFTPGGLYIVHRNETSPFDATVRQVGIDMSNPETVGTISEWSIPLGPGAAELEVIGYGTIDTCLLYTSPSPRDATLSRMPSSA